MSGEEYGHIIYKIEELIEMLEDKHSTHHKRLAFIKLLKLVAKAIHDINYVDSCDYSPGDEYEAIDECFRFCKTIEEGVKDK